MPQAHPRFERAGLLEGERRFDPFIEAYTPKGSRVIDLGCGTGELLDRLIREREIFARGVEITSKGVKACISRGLSVYQGDIDEGLEDFDDGIFDIVILNLTLSMLHYPDLVLTEAVRVGKQAIVTFFNAAYLPRRHRFLRHGTIGSLLPGEGAWYRSAHVHPFSVEDFEALCAERRIGIVDRTFVDPDFQPLGPQQANWPQGWSFAAIYLIQRK